MQRDEVFTATQPSQLSEELTEKGAMFRDFLTSRVSPQIASNIINLFNCRKFGLVNVNILL